MTNIAIHVENLGKRYRLGQREPYKTLRDTLARAAAASLRALRRGRDGQSRGAEAFWALRDVSFEVKEGEVLGIIGRNGAGKSTLLKILSHITDPTEGRVEIHGRLGSLLEVGTGFHPELTGRENIYLNGAILGMKKAEIESKFDEIVQFAGVEKFLDTPVKRYSSGMYVRLAFSVSAHLDPEILLVDEVLSVGDIEYQQKCLHKMNDVATEGRTVLFISHNMSAVRLLCTRAILFDRGCVAADGHVDSVIATYLTKEVLAKGDGIIPQSIPRFGTGEALLKQVLLSDQHGRTVSKLLLGQKLRVSTIYEVKTTIDQAALELGISTLDGLRILTVTSIDEGRAFISLRQGLYEIKVDLDVTLLPGEYLIDVLLHKERLSIDVVQRALQFTVMNQSESGKDQWIWTDGYGTVRGFIRTKSHWEEPIRLDVSS